MAITSCIKGGSGGGKGPFVAIVRVNGGNSQYFIDNSILKKYKYIRLLTAAEYNAMFSVTYATEDVTIGSVTFWVNRSTSDTLTTTTPKSIASLGLTDGDYCVTTYSHSGWGGYAVALYDDESDLR